MYQIYNLCDPRTTNLCCVIILVPTPPPLPHPTYIQMEEYHKNCDTQNKVIIRDLAEKSPSEDTKLIILHFDVDKNSDEIYKAMDKGFLKPALSDTADYLKIDTTGLLKDTIIRGIISKINTCLLEQCKRCSTYYSVSLDEDPVIVCECGQPCHTPCYKDIETVINEFPGIVFQCSGCLKTPAHNRIPDKTTASNKDAISHKTHKPASTHEDKGKPENPIQLKVINAFNLDLLQARYPQPSYPICEDYKRNNCQHGKDGKTEIDGETCTKLHPKKCFAWCKAGNDSKFGCSKGKECTYYHPILCRNSIRYRRCTNSLCTFSHLKFTKRYNNTNRGTNNPRSEDRNMQPPDSNIRINNYKPSNTQPIPWETQTAAKPNSERTFLEELIQSLKTDMKEAQNEMREFKKNISKQVAQLQPQLWQQNPNNQYQHPAQIDQNVAPNQMQQIQVNQPEATAVQLHPQQAAYQHVMYRQHPT